MTGCSAPRVEGWRPDLPDACKEPFIPLIWLKVLELLGRVPAGSAADSSTTARAGLIARTSTRTPPRPRARRRFLFAARRWQHRNEFHITY